MQETENYKLPLYDPDDPVNLFTGYNTAIETIDTTLKSIDDEAKQANEKANDNSNSISTHTNKIQQIYNKLKNGIKVENATITISSIGGSSYTNKTISYTIPNNYYVVGIVGFSLSGAYPVIGSCYISNQTASTATISLKIKNTASATASNIDVVVKVLSIKRDLID